MPVIGLHIQEFNFFFEHIWISRFATLREACYQSAQFLNQLSSPCFNEWITSLLGSILSGTSNTNSEHNFHKIHVPTID